MFNLQYHYNEHFSETLSGLHSINSDFSQSFQKTMLSSLSMETSCGQLDHKLLNESNISTTGRCRSVYHHAYLLGLICKHLKITNTDSTRYVQNISQKYY